MSIIIAGSFPSIDNAEAVAQECIDGGMEPQTIGIIIGQSQQQDTPSPEDQTATTTTGMLASGSAAILAGFTTILLPGVGWALAAGPFAAALGGIAATYDDTAQSEQILQILQQAGLTAAQARGFAADFVANHPIVVVHAETSSIDRIADSFHRYGGNGIDYRVPDAEGEETSLAP